MQIENAKIMISAYGFNVNRDREFNPYFYLIFTPYLSNLSIILRINK